MSKKSYLNAVSGIVPPKVIEKVFDDTLEQATTNRKMGPCYKCQKLTKSHIRNHKYYCHGCFKEEFPEG